MEIRHKYVLLFLFFIIFPSMSLSAALSQEAINALPIFKQAKEENLAAIQAYVEAGGDINITQIKTDPDGLRYLQINLLCTAFRNWNPFEEPNLFKADANIHLADENIAVIRYLLRQPDIDVNKKFIIRNDTIIPSLKNEDDANSIEATPLHRLMRSTCNNTIKTELMQALFNHNADPNIQDSDGNTPLHLVVIRLDIALARMLLEHDADPNIRNNKGETVLHRLLQYYLSTNGITSLSKKNHTHLIQLVQLLMAYQADPTIKTNAESGEESILHIVALASRFHTGSINLITTLLDSLAFRPINGKSELSLRSYKEKLKESLPTNMPTALIDYLIVPYTGEIDIDERDKKGRTPLMLVAESINVEALKLFIDAGANINAKDDEGNTPLHHAVMQHREHIISALLGYGAKNDIINKKDQTPLQLAYHIRDTVLRGYNESFIKEADTAIKAFDRIGENPPPRLPQKPTGTDQQAKSPKSMPWLLIALGVGSFALAIQIWRSHQAKKRFRLTVQQLIKLEQRKLNHEINEIVYNASKELLLAPYQNNLTMLKKIDIEVTIHLESLQGLEDLNLL